MPQASHPPITLVEYERLFRIIHAVLVSENREPAQASLFFSVAGAFVLRKHHRLKTVSPVAGGAAYVLPSPATAPLVFGRATDDSLSSDTEHHHCWIEADGWIIDLSAPLFDAHLSAGRKTGTLAPHMFLRPAAPNTSMASLGAPGTYLHSPNHKLSTALIKRFTDTPSDADLVRICERWYARPPKKIAPNIGIADQNEQSKNVPLSPIRLTGAL